MENGLVAVDVLSRWIHVGAAIMLLGGSAFMRYVLMPAAGPLPEAEHEALRGRVMDTWRKFVMIGIGLLLITGLYNYIRAIPQHEGQGLYHGLIGTKILLALVVFFLASALVGRSKALEGFRQDRPKWLAITILLAALVVALAGVAKVAVPSSSPGSKEEQANSETRLPESAPPGEPIRMGA